ncbi:MMPL family transporter [Rugosimonospora acidiphila]|uniref:MMPL family transporter n=1 Tax=Rugosimonospora acidiphila TaxID=556531 RepID=A0ABP9SV92_9ACTN
MHPWIALLIWAAFVGGSLSLSFLVGTHEASDNQRITGEAQHTAELATAAGYPYPATDLILVTGNFTSADAQQILTELSDTQHVESVTGPTRSSAGDALVYTVAINGDPDTASDRLAPLNATVKQLSGEFGSLTISETGETTIIDDFQTWLGKDLNRATAISIPTTLLILLITFGAIMIAVLPIAVGAASVLSALGLWAVASQMVPDTGIVPDVITLIGLAVGIDYALFYSRRYREEAHAGRGPVEATEIVARTAGHSIIVSGTAVAIAMAGLLLVRSTLYSGVAIGAILVVLVAMASAVTAMPALMRLFHRWIDKPRLPFVWRLASNKENRALRAVLRLVIRHPWIALGVAAVALGAMAAPALGMRLSSTTIDDYPPSLTSLQVYNEVRHNFPDTTSSAQIVLTSHAPDEAALRALADRVSKRTAAEPTLFGAASQPWISNDKRTLVLDVAVPYQTTSQQAKNAVRELRNNILPDTLGPLADADHGVGGDIASNLDETSTLARSMPWVIGIVIALTFVYMFAIYRSLGLALITILLNICSTLASFGLVTLIFQNTWAEGLLGFTSKGSLVSYIPLLLFVVLSGLSLDYHVLVVNRIRENARLRMTNKRSIFEGVAKTAGVVTAAAAVMIVVFAIFGTLSFIELKQMGVGLAIATLLDVTLIRVVTLPAALAALGRALWWPGKVTAVPDTDDSGDIPDEFAHPFAANTSGS